MARTFELSEEQEKKFEEWRLKKKETLSPSTIGGAYTFKFTPTGIGCEVVVECIDKTELDLTEDF